jgi:mRNA interferase RelE/StbE
MSYRINLTDRARKELLKLDPVIYQQIIKVLEHIATLANPRSQGKPLVGNLKGLWRYRSGNYRILAELVDNELLILVVEISGRKDAYR